LGGVETVADVLEYVSVGATAVQVGTASFSDPKASEAIVGGLAKGLNGVNMLTFNELMGRFSKENG
jgi:dihydroorotate dehydrogenase (NAD+) catalytic subunit